VHRMSQQKILFLLFAIYCSSGMSWKQIFTISGVAVAGFLYLIYAQQEKILYLNETIPPKRTSQNPPPYANPKQQGLEYEDVWITTTDNVKLHAWWIPHSSTSTKPAPTLIFYHANAGNMGFRLPNLVALHDKLKVNIFILSYRGYGESEGEPSEDGIKLDALAAFQYVYYQRKHEIDRSKIYIFGRSLGGAVAIYTTYALQELGKEKQDGDGDGEAPKVAGLIIENTFTSISDMVGKVFPFLDFDFVKKFMLKIHWRSIDRIPHIRTNLLFLACENDEIVPHQHMQTLFDSARNARTKDMFVIRGGTHNDGWMKGGEAYWTKLSDFIEST